MRPFMTYAEQHTVGVILVACALASILLMVVACFVLGGRDKPKRRRDITDVNKAARRSGFVESGDRR